MTEPAPALVLSGDDGAQVRSAHYFIPKDYATNASLDQARLQCLWNRHGRRCNTGRV
jgi:hypothetical protein